MILETVLSAGTGTVTTSSGQKICMGDKYFEAGDEVWTDGPYAFGNEGKSPMPLVIGEGAGSASGPYIVVFMRDRNNSYKYIFRVFDLAQGFDTYSDFPVSMAESTSAFCYNAAGTKFCWVAQPLNAKYVNVYTLTASGLTVEQVTPPTISATTAQYYCYIDDNDDLIWHMYVSTADCSRKYDLTFTSDTEYTEQVKETASGFAGFYVYKGTELIETHDYIEAVKAASDELWTTVTSAYNALIRDDDGKARTLIQSDRRFEKYEPISGVTQSVIGTNVFHTESTVDQPPSGYVALYRYTTQKPTTLYQDSADVDMLTTSSDSAATLAMVQSGTSGKVEASRHWFGEKKEFTFAADPYFTSFTFNGNYYLGNLLNRPSGSAAAKVVNMKSMMVSIHTKYEVGVYVQRSGYHCQRSNSSMLTGYADLQAAYDATSAHEGTGKWSWAPQAMNELYYTNSQYRTPTSTKVYDTRSGRSYDYNYAWVCGMRNDYYNHDTDETIVAMQDAVKLTSPVDLPARSDTSDDVYTLDLEDGYTMTVKDQASSVVLSKDAWSCDVAEDFSPGYSVSLSTVNANTLLLCSGGSICRLDKNDKRISWLDKVDLADNSTVPLLSQSTLYDLTTILSQAK